MPCSVFIIAFRRTDPLETHWAIFIPVREDETIGRLIQIIGNQSTGYELEFVRNFNLLKTNMLWGRWPLGLVDDLYAESNTTSSGKSSSSSSTIAPESVAAAAAASEYAAQFAPDPIPGPTIAHVAVQMSGVKSDASNVYSIDVNPCDALEEQAKKMGLPSPLPEGTYPALTQASQEWVTEYVNRMISCGIFPQHAKFVLNEAIIEEAGYDNAD